MAAKKFDVRDPRLAGEGRKRIVWAGQDMPVLRRGGGRVGKEKPPPGGGLFACPHGTAPAGETVQTPQGAGAGGGFFAFHPPSTPDGSGAALAPPGTNP